jgi:hypothetical protein
MEVRHGESVLWRIGHELIVITWLHEARRDVLKGHPRCDESGYGRGHWSKLGLIFS